MKKLFGLPQRYLVLSIGAFVVSAVADAAFGQSGISRADSTRSAAVGASLSGNQIAPSSTLDRVVLLNIESQNVSTAIIALSNQGKVQIVFQGNLLDGVTAPELRGEMPLKTALDRLLNGTQATYRLTDAGVVTIELPRAMLRKTPASASGVSASGSTQLEEIVVTATKRAQSVRDVPSTINVLSGAKLETEGARQLKDFIDQVPGVKVQEASLGGPDEVTIRGIGPQTPPGDIGGTNQTVGILYGDIPLSDPYSAYTAVDPDPWDLKDVEILKGPQGTLFGASSLAGIIRYVPNAPILGTWEAKGFAERDSIHDGGIGSSFGAALNVPLGATLAFRASGVVEHVPGVVDIDTVNREVRNADDAHKWQGRAMLLWRPLDRLTINAFYLDQQAHADELGFVNNTNGQLQRNNAPDPSPSHRDLGLGSLDVRYAFDWATLVSLTGLQHKGTESNLDSTFSLPGNDFAENGISAVHSLVNSRANGDQQEIRLVSPDGGHWVWLTGAFYSAYRGYVFSNTYVTNTAPIGTTLPAGLGSIFGSSQGLSEEGLIIDPLKAREEALFGEVTRKLGPVDITLGGRLYRTNVSGIVKNFGVLGTVANQSPEAQGSRSVADHGFSPKVSLAYHADKDLMLYATASRGFQYGGVNIIVLNLNNDPTSFKSSTLWNYEAGVRSDWLHRTLRFDLAVFYLDWTNAQIEEKDSTPAVGAVFTDNVGVVRSRGIESTLRYLPPWIRGISFEVNGSYNEAKTGVTFTDVNGTQPSGTTMPNAPTLQAASTLAYTVATDHWRLQPSLIYTHTNTSWNDIGHDYRLEARDIFNFNFSLTRGDLSFSPALTLVVDNLTDQKRITQFASGGSGTVASIESLGGLASNLVNYTRPRTIELRFSADF